MKNKITWLLCVLLALNTIYSNAQTRATTLTSKEREFAIKFLKETETQVINDVRGLSETQLKFKPAADKWSVEDCIKHIAASEKELWAMTLPTLKQPANPEKRADIKVTDTTLIRMVEDRSHKAKTVPSMEPATSPYNTSTEAITGFKDNRDQLIAYVKDTQEDLRGHVMALPFGTLDTYQLILLISAHSNRHMQQIDEVKANANFPKQ